MQSIIVKYKVPQQTGEKRVSLAMLGVPNIKVWNALKPEEKKFRLRNALNRNSDVVLEPVVV